MRNIVKQFPATRALDLDRAMSAYISEHGRDALTQLKRDSYNIQLENLVVNRDTEKLYAVHGNHIVPRSGYVYLTPRSRNGRAPFYSGVKVLGYYEIDTLWYNLAVLLLMCVIVGVCLFTDFPGNLVRKERN